MFHLSNLNYTLEFEMVNSRILSVFKDKSTYAYHSCNDVKCVQGKLFDGNGLSRILSITCADKDDIYTDCEITNEESTYTLSLKFVGMVNFSILLRPNGNARISASGTYFRKDNPPDNVYVLMQKETEFFASLVEKFIPCVHFRNKEEPHYCLINGVYNVNHTFQNTEKYAEFLRETNVFCVVDCPNYAGAVRRKGNISMYVYKTKKNGVVKVNKKSLHLMGFVCVKTLVETLKNLDFLIGII